VNSHPIMSGEEHGWFLSQVKDVPEPELDQSELSLFLSASEPLECGRGDGHSNRQLVSAILLYLLLTLRHQMP
jgi:hypothetical protein